jgi:hypothetical protein
VKGSQSIYRVIKNRRLVFLIQKKKKKANQTRRGVFKDVGAVCESHRWQDQALKTCELEKLIQASGVLQGVKVGSCCLGSCPTEPKYKRTTSWCFASQDHSQLWFLQGSRGFPLFVCCLFCSYLSIHAYCCCCTFREFFFGYRFH